MEPLKVDMHSHLLPGIDDGSKNIPQTLEMIRQMIDMGYEKLIMTPHIISDSYKNTPEIILEKLDRVKEKVEQQKLNIELEAAAEYYLDEAFIKMLENNDKLLTFGGNYLLFETAFINRSSQFDHAIFLMQSLGYQPVFAHPERYIYLYDSYEEFAKLKERGVMLQVNINSLAGYYSKTAREVAEKLIDDGLISFLGSDCHSKRHFPHMEKARQTPHYNKALQQKMLNNSLLS
ncbi:CpsB/CapC family capsule biosynthesis tyrosine phosphatase [Flammeovirgaceae bacterium SG7u.111]|nr:CpsB/CapC family capsule biosynthesis tyrosine phosphatase [Flammeovirgaceae bacterium SG7u.132]WPO36526.1 CpsB/CapC family capsule biosynthesis tyrosine phosphatase [Flammeovirgaceae bacterium SG7u.111]